MARGRSRIGSVWSARAEGNIPLRVSPPPVEKRRRGVQCQFGRRPGPVATEPGLRCPGGPGRGEKEAGIRSHSEPAPRSRRKDESWPELEEEWPLHACQMNQGYSPNIRLSIYLYSPNIRREMSRPFTNRLHCLIRRSCQTTSIATPIAGLYFLFSPLQPENRTPWRISAFS